MQFCEKCNNVLQLKTNDKGIISNYCKLCDKYTIINTIIYEQKKYVSDKSDRDMLISMSLDETYPVLKIKCINNKCCNNLITYFTNDKMQNVYLCRECGVRWDKNI